MVSLGLASVGGLVIFIASIMLLVQAFRVNIWWGLLIFVPILGVLVFSFANWGKAKAGFLLHMVGVVVGAAGFVVILEKLGWVNAEPESEAMIEAQEVVPYAHHSSLPDGLTWS